MRKGKLAGLLMGLLMLSAPATFAACCPGDAGAQGPGDEWQVGSSGRSYLGVEVSDISRDRVAELKLRDESGVEVMAVDADSPAGKAGIKEHDVILTINAQPIESEEQLRRIIHETPAGRTIKIGISRDGQPMTLSAGLASRKNSFAWSGPKVAPMPPMPPQVFSWSEDMPDVPEVVTISRGNRIGAMVESITPQLADFFGVKDGAGLLVRSVEKGSIAEKAGLKAGDVIVRIEKERVNDLSDWRRLLRNKSGNVPVSVIRDKREQNLTVNLPERKQSGSLYGPDLDGLPTVAELKIELSGVPEAAEQARKAMEEARKEFEANRGEYEKEMAKASKELQKALKEQQKEMEKMQKDLQKSFKTISLEED